MLRDLAVLGWLVWRQLAGHVGVWLAPLGVDPTATDGWNRLYVWYAALLVLGWLVVMSAFGLAQAQTIGAQLPTALRTSLLDHLPLLVLGAQALIVGSGLRGPPLELSPPTQAYVQPSPVRRVTLVLLAFAQHWIPIVLGTAALTLLVLTGLVPAASASSLLTSAGVLALWVTLGITNALLGRWVIGCLRCRTPAQDHRSWLPPSLLAGLVALLPTILVAGGIPSADLLAGTTAWWMLLGLASSAVGVVWLMRVSAQLDLARVADARAGRAGLRRLGPLAAVVNPEGVRTLTRRARLTAQAPTGTLRGTQGLRLLVARGVLAARRDPREVLVRCAVLAVVAIASSVLIGSGVLTPAWLQWLTLLAALRPTLTDPNLELAVREPFVRQLMAGHLMPLLVSGTLVPSMGATMVGVAYWAAIAPTGGTLVAGVLLTGLSSGLVPLITGWCLLRAPESGWAPLLLSSGSFGGIALVYIAHPVAGVLVGAVLATLMCRQIQVHDRLVLPRSPGR